MEAPLLTKTFLGISDAITKYKESTGNIHRVDNVFEQVQMFSQGSKAKLVQLKVTQAVPINIR